MPEEQVEKEPQERIVEIGEWFNPFKDYHKVPYENEDLVGLVSKTFPFLVSKLGKFEVDLKWDKTLDWVEGNKGIVILPFVPFDNELIDMKNIRAQEKKLKSRLFWPTVWNMEEKFRGQEFPYCVQVELPSGQIFNSLFTATKSSEPVAAYWFEKEQQENLELLIPEDETILAKIQMRIVPIEEK